MPTTTEVKILSDNGRSFTVAGYGVIWGGQDVVGDFFTKSTDFWFDRLTQTPMVLFQHGQDQVLKRTVVGRVVTKQPDDIGLWVEAQITAAKQYADAIRELVSKGVLGWSSGSVPHLVQRVKGTTPGTSEITSWPVVELSLTPTPAEPRTVGVKELKALAKFDPELLEALEDQTDLAAIDDARMDPENSGETVDWEDVKATLDANARDNLSGSSFAYIDSNGGRHLPINDEAHVRAAMSRFNQTSFESPDKKKAAARKILAKARSLGIDVSADSAVASAAKGATLLTDLPDSAFAWIEPGGTKDDGGLTFPRAKRLYPHHDENGLIDPERLADSLTEARKSADTDVVAHLLRHQAAIDSGERDDAHSPHWKGAAADYLVGSVKCHEHALAIFEQNLAMEKLHQDTKNGALVQPELRQRGVEIVSDLQQTNDWSEMVDHGADGRARVNRLRAELELMEV